MPFVLMMTEREQSVEARILGIHLPHGKLNGAERQSNYLEESEIFLYIL